MDYILQQSKQGAILTLRLTGRLDAALAERLAEELREIIRGGEQQLVFDLAEVAYLSSAGIRFLLTTYQALKKLGGSFGVVRPSPAVKSVLELSGLTLLLREEPGAPLSAATPPAPAAAREARIGALRYVVYETAPGATLACRLAGDPALLEQARFDPQGGELVPVTRDLIALGLGRFEQAGSDAQASFGEFLAVGGTAICLPADGAPAPDYMLTTGALVPQVRALYALVGQGRFARCIRFAAEDKEGRESLSGLVRAGLELAGAPAVGLIMLAESAGLIGAALKRAPAGSGAVGSLFAYPGIKDWLNFTPERVYDRRLVLAAGIALQAPRGDLAPFVRPLGAAQWPAGHFHAAVFTSRAIPNGPLALEHILPGIFEDAKLLAVMHLLNDHREISGVGESLFTRGALWLGPVSVAGRREPR